MNLKKTNLKENNFIKGILLYSGCIFLFALLGATSHYFGETYPVNELIFFRSIIPIIIILGLAARKKNTKIFLTKHYKLHIIRSIIGFAAVVFLTLSYIKLPIVDASTIQYTSPFVVAILSGPILGERISFNQLILIFICFSGIFFAFNPDLNNLNIGIMYGFLGVIFISFVAIILRKMSKTENSNTTILYYNTMCAFISGCWLFYNWITPSILDSLFLILVGVLSYGAQMFLTNSYKWASPNILSPFDYVGIIWYGAIGYLVFGDLPSNELLIGCSLVVCSGLYMVCLEIQKKKLLNYTSYGQIRR
ncbi:MAG: DMT family transporter [Alphaproteobacteria bacterium]|nr:DMT family transporter [Alphaproteobacteria bacterium]